MSRNRRSVPAAVQAVAVPVAAAELAEAFARIDRCRRLQADWDGEGALPIEEEVADRATTLLGQAAEEVRTLGLQWQNPDIAPSPDGALELSWEVGERWALVVVSPGQVSIECVVQEGSSPPRRSRESLSDAIRMAIWTLQPLRSGAAT